jgi:DNA polymerase-3 subunit beta
MKIVCDREDLLPAFQTAAMVAPARSPKAILQHVKLVNDGERTTLMATDLEIGIRVEVDNVESLVPGTVLLSTAQFGSLLRESSDERIRIESDGTGIFVYGDRSKFKLGSIDPEGFPLIAEFSEAKYHQINSRLMKELIRRTLFATDAESSRYALGGVLLEFQPEKIIAVATDGRRLAKMEGPAACIGGHDGGNTTTIVPTRAMQLIDRALADSDEPVKVSVRGNDILVQFARTTIIARLVEGKFPKWRDVFPQRQNALLIQLTAGPVYSALRQAAVVASNESRGIDFVFGGGNLVMHGTTAEVGESRVELPVGYDGSEIKLSLDHRYIGDFLRVLNPESVFTLDLVDRDSAALCRTDDGYGYVIMPLSRERPMAAAASAAS